MNSKQNSKTTREEDLIDSKQVEKSEARFRSENVNKNFVNMMNVGKSGSPPIEIVFAPYSKLYYYLIEDAKYDSKAGDESCNLIVMRIGVYIDKEKGRLMLQKGFTRRDSENFYKSSRHASKIRDFLDTCKKDPTCITIWDRPDQKKESGYININFNCGIDDPKELAQLKRLIDDEGKQMNYLIIESSKPPIKHGMKITRETKQSMLFADDITNFRNWVSDVANFEQNSKSEIKKASTSSFFIAAADDARLSRAAEKACQREREQEGYNERGEEDEAEDDDDDDEDDDDDDEDEDDEEEKENEDGEDKEEDPKQIREGGEEAKERASAPTNKQKVGQHTSENEGAASADIQDCKLKKKKAIENKIEANTKVDKGEPIKIGEKRSRGNMKIGEINVEAVISDNENGEINAEAVISDNESESEEEKNLKL